MVKQENIGWENVSPSREIWENSNFGLFQRFEYFFIQYSENKGTFCVYFLRVNHLGFINIIGYVCGIAGIYRVLFCWLLQKAMFISQHYNLKPNEILVTGFNRINIVHFASVT